MQVRTGCPTMEEFGENKIERWSTVKNFECDFLQELKPSAILGLFQEIAAEHSELMGFGHTVLKKDGMFWVLSKIYVEIEKEPVYMQKIKISTWPHAPNKAIFERSFSIEDENGERMISAYSRWCVLNAQGRIVPASRIPCGVTEFIGEKSVDFEDWLSQEPAEKGCAAFSIRIANSEYDLNYHVNNIKYADYIFNCFSVKELETRRLKNFQIHYVKQSHEGDLLEFYREETEPGVFSVAGIKNGAETVVTAKVCFDDADRV